MYVFDATPLISLASIDRVTLVTALDGDCCLPESVHEEVVTEGVEGGHADARRVERAVEDDCFSVEPDPETRLAESLKRSDGLSEADAAVLALAAARDGTAVMDEQYGRTVADVEGIPTRGTAFVVLTAQKRELIDADEALEIIDELLAAGWYCAPDLYARIQRKIEAID